MDGIPYANEKFNVCSEYFIRRSLKDIGFVFRPDDITDIQAVEFHLIAGELARLQAEKFDRETKKGKKR